MSISTDATESRAELEVKKSKSQENSTLKTVLICGALLIPVFFLFFIIIRYGVDVLYWDELDFADEYLQLMNGGNFFEIIFRQHNEHRLVFPKLVMYLSAIITGYNTKVEMFISALLCCFSYFALIKISIGKKIKDMTLSDTVFSVFIGFCLFTLCQYENIIWGMQCAWFMISFSVVGAFWFLSLYIKTEENKYYVFMLIFATIACYSSLHGLAVWLALGVVIIGLIVTKSSSNIKRWIPMALTGILEIILYFCGFQTINNDFKTDSFFSFIVYWFQLIGSPFRLFSSDWLQFLLGFLFFVLTVSLILYLIIMGKYRDFIGQIGIIVYSFGVDAMFAIGRGGLSTDVPSRYTTCTVLAVVALISIIYKLFISELYSTKGKYYTAAHSSFITGAITSGAIVMLTVYQSFDTLALNKIQDRSAILNIIQNYNDAPLTMLQQVYPFVSYENAYERIERIKENHLSCFNGSYTLTWGEADASAYTIVPEQANCDFGNGLSWSEDNKILYLNSWAIITEFPIPSNNVLVKINNKYYNTQNQISRPDVADAFGSENYTNSGFGFQKNTDVLNAGINSISVLVISEDDTTAYETSVNYVYKNEDGSIFKCDEKGTPIKENGENTDDIDTSELFAPEISYSDILSIKKPDSTALNICVDSMVYNDGVTNIGGWIFDTESNGSFDEVYLHFGDSLYRLRAQTRKDVQSAYSLTDSNVGFIEQIHGEIEEYSIVVKPKNSDVYYEYDAQTVNSINDANHKVDYAEKYSLSDIVTDSLMQMETDFNIDRFDVQDDTTIIAGWIIDHDSSGGFEEVYLLSGDELFKLSSNERTDVQDKYNLSDADVGFGAVIEQTIDNYSLVVKPYYSYYYYQVQVS